MKIRTTVKINLKVILGLCTDFDLRSRKGVWSRKVR